MVQMKLNNITIFVYSVKDSEEQCKQHSIPYEPDEQFAKIVPKFNGDSGLNCNKLIKFKVKKFWNGKDVVTGLQIPYATVGIVNKIRRLLLQYINMPEFSTHKNTALVGRIDGKIGVTYYFTPNAEIDALNTF